ncbi:MAG: carboxypeptidase-like regulatory domain-containing protein [Caldilineaceae bacterium]
MNNANKKVQQVAKRLQTKSSHNQDLAEASAELAAQIAQDAEATQQLAEMSAAFQDKDSKLLQDIAQIHELDRWLEQIGAYVEAERNGLAAAQLYPEVATRIVADAFLRNEYESLRASMADTALFAQTPGYANFKEWRRRQQSATVAAAAPTGVEPLWRQLENGLYQLAAEIPVRLRAAAATFGPLPPGLTLQTAPAAAFRNHGGNQSAEVVWLELPHMDGLHTTRVYVGPVQNNNLTFIVEVVDSATKEPVPAIDVELCTLEGDLLESASTDARGRTAFERLDIDAYRVRVNRVNEFVVNLESM